MLALLRHLCGLSKVRHRGRMGDCCSYDARGINDMNASWVCLDRRSHSWCVVSTGEVLLLTMCFVPGTSKYVDWCVTRPTYVWQQQPDLPLLDLSVLLGFFCSSLLAQPGSNYGSTRYRVVPGTAAHAERTRTCWSTEYYDYCRFLLPAPYIGFACFSLQVLLYSYLPLQQQLTH